jgi:LCP family protein required for cell wall assembly
MDNYANQSPEPTPRRGSIWKAIGVIFGLVIVLVIGFSAGVVLHALKSKPGEVGASKSIVGELSDIGQVAVDPRQGFPGKSKIVICCMGIDDNWTNSDVVYTNGARTDTLFLLTLDLETRKATMLSIPRDAFVPIAGTHYSTKINAAYATGGPKRTESTIDEWVGVSPDYYVVLNIDATKRMVDALGGVDVNVEHEMNYDDDWGHLHVHLNPGFQHLDGDQAVGFARFRHGNKGLTPEDGDERRMYRQHMLFKAMIGRAKSFSTILQANKLIDIGMSCIHTDMTRTQLFDLAALFHGANPDTDVTTASLNGEDANGPYGASIMLVDRNVAKAYCDWLVNGNENAVRALTPVRIANATSTQGLAARASSAIVAAGFTGARLTPASTTIPSADTEIVDSGVPDHAAATEIAAALGLPSAQVIQQPNQPNRFGWTASPNLKVVLGSDFAKQNH